MNDTSNANVVEMTRSDYARLLRFRRVVNVSNQPVCCQCGHPIVNEAAVIPLSGALANLVMHKRCEP